MIEHEITFGPRDLGVHPRFAKVLLEFVNSTPKKGEIRLVPGPGPSWVIAYISKKGKGWGLSMVYFAIDRLWGEIYFHSVGSISSIEPSPKGCGDSVEIMGAIDEIEVRHQVRNGEHHYLIRPQNMVGIRLVGIPYAVQLKHVAKRYMAYYALAKQAIEEKEIWKDLRFEDTDFKDLNTEVGE